MARGKGRHLDHQIRKIIKDIELNAAEIARLAEEGARQAEVERQQWDAKWQEWQRQEEEQRKAKVIKESREEILEIINSWATAKHIAAFFDDVERSAVGINEDERLVLLERLKLAREMIGGVDTLRRLKSWKAPDERQ